MKISRPRLILAVSFLALSVAFPCSALTVFADGPLSSPKSQRFCSPNAEYCVKVVPRPRGAKARLLRRQGRKRYKRLSAFRLVNQSPPRKALVSNDGRHVVTFDDWYSTGYGPNVVVIYQADGTVTRNLALEDFLSKQEIFSGPRALSNDWSGDHFIREDDGVLVLRVVRPACPARDPPREEARGFFDVEIESVIRLRQWRFKPFLVDGVPTPAVGRVALTFGCVARGGSQR